MNLWKYRETGRTVDGMKHNSEKATGLVNEIKDAAEQQQLMLDEFMAGDGWRALGYASPAEWRDVEMGDVDDALAKLIARALIEDVRNPNARGRGGQEAGGFIAL
ncbi:hypothetical protein [Mycolicibacter heraklionensis]|nr:hypothetical protein [Mycolicibacter heraklionensis]